LSLLVAVAAAVSLLVAAVAAVTKN